jgi:hypothetical protein
LTASAKDTGEATLKKPEAKQMDWSNKSHISSWVIVMKGSMGRQKPWCWFRVIFTTDGVDNKSGLSHLFAMMML